MRKLSSNSRRRGLYKRVEVRVEPRQYELMRPDLDAGNASEKIRLAMDLIWAGAPVEKERAKLKKLERDAEMAQAAVEAQRARLKQLEQDHKRVQAAREAEEALRAFLRDRRQQILDRLRPGGQHRMDWMTLALARKEALEQLGRRRVLEIVEDEMGEFKETIVKPGADQALAGEAAPNSEKRKNRENAGSGA